MYYFMPYCIKAFFIFTGSFYLYLKILNHKIESKKLTFSIVYTLLFIPLLVFLRIHYPLYTILVEAIVLTVLSTLIFKDKLFLSLSISTMSLGLSYVFFSISAIIVMPIMFIMFSHDKHTILSDIINMSLISIIQNFLGYFLFKIKRFKKGLPSIANRFSEDVGVFIGIVLILISSFMFTNDENDTLLSFILIFVTLFLGIVIYLWWKKYIFNHYLRQSQNRHISILEETIKKKDEEIQQLSKIIHKDNKLLGALSLTVQEVLTENNEIDKEKLLTEIQNLTDERHKTLSTYEKEEQNLPTTGVVSTDIILNYLSKRAVDKDINFSIAINCSIGYFTESVFNENDLSTILADLGENAIIAVNKAINKNIMISFGIENDCYVISIFDSGLPFDSSVIANIGKRRYTTHKNEGGSGIGLMTTMELLKPYSASFEIEEINDNTLFTKKVSVAFDGKSNIRVKSLSPDVIAESKKRIDILITE